MRRKAWIVLSLLCSLALIGAVALGTQDASEEGRVKRLLDDLPEATHEGDREVWGWLRTARVPRPSVEARLTAGLRGRKGWSHDAVGWSYNPNYIRPWWSRIPLLGQKINGHRPILWVMVQDRRAVRIEERARPQGQWTTVRLEAMASYAGTSRLLSRWVVRR